MVHIFPEKVGLVIVGPVTIRDTEGKPVFSSLETNKRVINCPPGKWSINGDFAGFANPVKYARKELKDPVRSDYKEITLKLGSNPFKATINTKTGVILLDYSFYCKLNQCQKDFVILHEMGHFFYDGEKECDSFAFNKLLEYGYNPSSIFICKDVLTDGNRHKNMNQTIHHLRK